MTKTASSSRRRSAPRLAQPPAGLADGAVGSAAVQVTDLVVRYGSTVAVDGVSFTLRRGRVLALLGSNGAGKTSTVEVCEGLRRPDAGAVQVLGVDPHRHRSGLMSHVGVMLQAGGVYPGARVAEMVRLMASFAATPLDVPALIDRLGLAHVAGTAYRRLSGGEKQRLGLALAIVGRPAVVILDEPTAGMDTQARHDTIRLIEELRTAGVSVLLTTHLLDEAERLADDVVILHRGRVVATGSPAELTAATGIERLQVGAPPGLPLAPLLAALPAGLTAAEPAPGEYAIGGITDPVFGQVLATVTAWCEQQRATITDLRTERRTLEQVFLALVEGAAGGTADYAVAGAVAGAVGAAAGPASGAAVPIPTARTGEPARESEVRR